MSARNKGDLQITAAAKAGISERSGRRIENGNISQGDKPMRHWRTRKDHFKGVWENEVVPMLKQNAELQPLTLFEHFADKYPEKFQRSKLRTFQRKVKKWKALNGSGKEVMFLQEKIPGRMGLSGFTKLKKVTITINGEPLKHLLYHFRLIYSGWCHVKVAQLWEPLLSRAQEEHWNPAQYLATLCEQEVNERYSRRIARFTKESHLPVGKSLETFNFNHTPAIRQEKIEALAQNSDWVKRAENLLFFGPSGVGKTHLAAAISHALIEQSIRVRHFTTTALVQKMQQARADLQLESFLSKLDKYAVIVLDDLGYVKKSDAETHVLFELIAHRYETGSIIITSNQPFGEWDKIFADPSMTVAAIDRVVHHSIIIEIQADSHRKRQAISRNMKSHLEPEPIQEDKNKTTGR